MTLKKILPQKFNHQPDECLDVMMYTLELSRPCTCKDERGKNELWPSAYGLYLYKYICTLFEFFYFFFISYVQYMVRMLLTFIERYTSMHPLPSIPMVFDFAGISSRSSQSVQCQEWTRVPNRQQGP